MENTATPQVPPWITARSGDSNFQKWIGASSAQQAIELASARLSQHPNAATELKTMKEDFLKNARLQMGVPISGHWESV